MNKHLVLLSLFLFLYQKSFAAAELLVKADSVSIAGHSAISSDLLTIYGGIAGNACPTTDDVSTCNSCIDTSGGINACNQKSVYSSLKLSISFKLTKSVTGIARLFVESTTAGVFDPVATIASTAYTADTSTVTLETTWGEVCSRAGLTGSCTTGSSAAVFASKGIRFGVDSDNSGEVEDAERKAVTIKLHYIPVGATDAEQAYCPTTAAGAGICNLAFLPGDAKVYIDSVIYNGDDVSAPSVTWESIAVFPVPVTTPGTEAAIYNAFANGQAQPIFKTIDPTDGSIPDSQVAGGISNYQKYCMVYATKNQAQNIYKFVTTGIDTDTSCVTPSEVVGVLEDKHCFISTAAFGAESAPEVEVFRKFRNTFLLTNLLGKSFVKFYYKISPPIADIISANNYLKILTRIILYPFLAFAFVSLKIGFLLTVLVLVLLLATLIKLSRYIQAKKALIILAVLLITPLLKAEVLPREEAITHPQAQEGLVRIKKDGTYVYDIERPLRKESSRITFGQANHPEMTLVIQPVDAAGNPAGAEKEFNFSDFYGDTSGFILGYDYEWFPFIDKGKFGVQAGFSAMFANGNGRLAAAPNDPSVETFTFLTLPLTLGGVYRLEWKDKQIFAPYVSGGGTYVLLAEKREDKSMPSFIGSLGYYASGGVLFNVNAFDRDAGFQLESEYGISNMWVSLEFRVIEVTSSAFSFSNKYLNAGLSFDF